MKGFSTTRDSNGYLDGYVAKSVREKKEKEELEKQKLQQQVLIQKRLEPVKQVKVGAKDIVENAINKNKTFSSDYETGKIKREISQSGQTFTDEEKKLLLSGEYKINPNYNANDRFSKKIIYSGAYKTRDDIYNNSNVLGKAKMIAEDAGQKVQEIGAGFAHGLEKGLGVSGASARLVGMTKEEAENADKAFWNDKADRTWWSEPSNTMNKAEGVGNAVGGIGKMVGLSAITGNPFLAGAVSGAIDGYADFEDTEGIIRNAASDSLFMGTTGMASKALGKVGQNVLKNTALKNSIVANILARGLANFGGAVTGSRVANIPLEDEDKATWNDTLLNAGVYTAFGLIGDSVKGVKINKANKLQLNEASKQFEQRFKSQYAEAFKTTDPMQRMDKFNKILSELDDLQKAMEQNTYLGQGKTIESMNKGIGLLKNEVNNQINLTSSSMSNTNVLGTGAKSLLPSTGNAANTSMTISKLLPAINTNANVNTSVAAGIRGALPTVNNDVTLSNNLEKGTVLGYTENRGDNYGEKRIDFGRNQGEIENTQSASNNTSNGRGNITGAMQTGKTRRREIARQAKLNRLEAETDIEKQIVEKAKELGMNVYFYKDGNGSELGFAYENDVYLDKLGDEPREVIFSHELFHHLRQSANPIFTKEIKPIMDEFAESDDVTNVIMKFSESLEEELSITEIAKYKDEIVEEIFADYSAKILANYNVDYDMNSSMYSKLKESMLKITTPFDMQADTTPAFSMPENNTMKFKSSEAPRPYMDLNRYVSRDNSSTVAKTALSDMEKLINDIVPVRTGKFRERAYGIYKNNSEIIRIKEKNDIPVALHELSHHLDKKYRLSSGEKVSNELLNLAVAPKKAPYLLKIKEGVAEFGRYYMTNREYAKKVAPFYFEAFEKAINNDPDMKNKIETLSNMVNDYLNQSPLNRVLSHVDFGDEGISLWGNVKSKALDFKQSFRKNFVDELDPLKQIINDITGGKELPINKDAYSLLRLNNGVTGKVRVALEYGIVDGKGNKVDKSLKEIIEPVSDRVDEFVAYLSALRANDLMNRDIETGFNKKDVEEILKLYENDKVFQDASKDLYKFQNQILQKTLVNSGIISKDALKEYNRANPHYVPFYRVMDENFKQSKDSLSKKPKNIKGSTRDIINPLESIIKNTYSYMMIADKNDAYKSLFNLANTYDGTGKWFDRVPTDMVGTKVPTDAIKDILEQLNLDQEDVNYDEVFTTIFRPAYNQKGNIITVMDEGKPVHYEIIDKELYDILAPANEGKKENILLKLLNGGATALRTGATHSPEFVFRNPIRDTLDATTYSKSGFVPFVDTIRGIFEIAGKSDLYYKWLESGGSGSSYTNAQRTTLKNTLKGILPEVADGNKPKLKRAVDNTVNAAKHPLKTYLDVVGNISNMMEEGTRVGEFKRTLEKTNDLKKSALESRNITVDFSRSGIQARDLNRYIAFLNANIQGLDKMITSFKERPVATTLKALAYLTIPSLIIRAMQDDEKMEKIPQWEKDTYWVFFAGDTPIKIPKPQGLGQLFATIPERALDFIKTKDADAFDGLAQRLISSYSPIDSPTSLIPTGGQPLIENATNYSFFRQQPIVKQSLQNRSPKYQYDENTSTIAKALGNLGVSPKKVDNIISGYFGNLGKDIVNIAGMPIDIYNNVSGGNKESQEYKDFNAMLRTIPLIKGFIANDTYNADVDKFYDEKAKANTEYTDAKFKYQEKEMTTIQKQELNGLKKINSLYNSSYNNIKEIDDQMDDIRKGNTSNKDKKSKLEELDERKKAIAAQTKEKAESIRKELPTLAKKRAKLKK